ncbi:glycosyltransferase family 2 protein [Denitromonas ohlonensis]|uniref:Glycosyltransferase family 2 protein n=2 Tax=Denitromonas TaxID=139331 RepID=A0A557R543_9RHOO|nr:glycosyltransferase family 2 protein [Denitromonas ohlonensis]TVO60279.1 glycosyltransferase family 2 protein [Denitromonas ohlonensis]TVO75742.1 glycosyltransferase family 2 protein [Denitromonas ohlonensis]
MTSVPHHAPVALFVFNRPEHTRRTLEALRLNALAEATPLHIFSDAPRDDWDGTAVQQVREAIRAAEGFASVTIVERECNMGLAASIIDGATQLCRQYGQVIVLEDDLLTAPTFLTYMNDALDRYRDTPQVGSISAYMYPIDSSGAGSDTVMLEHPMSWGWATWADRWALFDVSGEHLLQRLKETGQLHRFDSLGPGGFERMLRGQIAGQNNSWFIRWHASLFLAERRSLAPARSLISNIGLDGTGVHCNEWLIDPFAVQLSDAPIEVTSIPMDIAPAFHHALNRFFCRSRRLRYINALYRLLPTTLKRLIRRNRNSNGR